jgi:diguanylate cyclase (GGDEF)-like protein
MSESKNNPQNIDDYRDLINDLEREISYLHSLVSAYENLSSYKEQEFKEIKSTVIAYEQLKEFEDKEKHRTLTTIDAYKQVSDLKTRELRDSKEMIHAYEQLSTLHKQEIHDARTTIDALENAMELTRAELKQFHDRFESFRTFHHPVEKEMFEILEEDADNKQHILMKLNLLNLKVDDKNFHSHLFNVLTNLDFEEEEAKEHWKNIVSLNKEMSEKQGRTISFRVSLLDYFIEINKNLETPKLIELKFFESALTNVIFDKLTGLLNRSHLAIAVRGSIRNARREGRLCAIIKYDLDNFSKFNGFFGNAEGDKLLKSFGSILTEIFAGANTAFRYGGEEFLTITEADTYEAIQQQADEARSRLVENWRDSIIPVSVSGGYAVYPEDGNNIDELVNKADKALYDAKYSGKNMVLRYSENRRKHSRLFESHHVALKINGDATGEIAAITHDIGTGGIALETEKELQKGGKIDIYLDDTNRDDASKVTGNVLWVHTKEENGKLLYIAGIEFDDSEKSSEIYRHFSKPD